MFGKFSIIPNRQLTPSDVTEPSDVDLTQPEWLTKCGVCHTGGGISEFDLRGRRLLPPEARPKGALDPSYTIRDRITGKVVPWDWQKSGITEADCFIGHVPKASRGDRRELVSTGNFRWANNATLAKSDIVLKDSKGNFTYNRKSFNTDGTVKSDVLNLSDPPLDNCAQCHGFSARNASTIQPIQHADILRGTEKAGWIYNGSKISETISPRIAGKEKMDYPWDVHAAKGLGCIDCHFSPNNPGRKFQGDAEKHLSYKPVGEGISEYLKRPDPPVDQRLLPYLSPPPICWPLNGGTAPTSEDRPVSTKESEKMFTIDCSVGLDGRCKSFLEPPLSRFRIHLLTENHSSL
ncbi:MAG: hypothetical protein IPP78_02330 [Holophagaceae bacterium]|nr:hypothetical protein [Holophagaceae bacterium]